MVNTSSNSSRKTGDSYETHGGQSARFVPHNGLVVGATVADGTVIVDGRCERKTDL